MPHWIIDFTQTYLTSKPTIAVIFILMIMYHYIDKMRINKYYSVGACRGNPAFCKYDIYRDQLSVIDVRFDAMIKGVYLQWKLDFEKYIEDKKLQIDISEKEKIFKLMKAVFYSCFIRGKNMVRRSALENHLPDTGTAEFDRYVKEKFDYVWQSFWEEYEIIYEESLFYMPLRMRKEVLETRRDKLYSLMYEMYQVMNDKKNAIIQANKDIQKRKILGDIK